MESRNYSPTLRIFFFFFSQSTLCQPSVNTNWNLLKLSSSSCPYKLYRWHLCERKKSVNAISHKMMKQGSQPGVFFLFFFTIGNGEPKTPPHPSGSFFNVCWKTFFISYNHLTKSNELNSTIPPQSVFSINLPLWSLCRSCCQTLTWLGGARFTTSNSTPTTEPLLPHHSEC